MVCFSCSLQLRRLGQGVDDAVDAGAAVALGLQLGEQVDVLALAPAMTGASTWKRVALLELEDLVDDLPGCWPGDDRPHVGQCGCRPRA
jgi:hypothetical protein